eukprot:scaffold191781_cov48-Prasinocladus_malaysianus.AAC.1
MDISPIRLTSFPLGRGSLQRLYLAGLYNFENVLMGEAQSRIERITRTERSLRRFDGKMVALSPPILFQRRVDASLAESVACKVLRQFFACFPLTWLSVQT